MALTAKSLFTYDIEVTSLNRYLDFKIDAMGTELTAVMDLGFYSPQGLADEIALQMQTVDSANIYTITVHRNIMGGTQNRISIETNGAFLSLLFASGFHTITSISTLIGFNPVDYTGNTIYTGSSSVGVTFIPDFIGYNYLDDFNMQKVFGAVNVSASGLKESVTFNLQFFIEVEFRYEHKSRLISWRSLFTWLIQQKQFDFTPEISVPDVVYTVTLEQTDSDDQGLAYRMDEMLPDFPQLYKTGKLKFRIIPRTSQFISL